MVVFVCLMWFLETDEYLFIVFLCCFPPSLSEFKVVFMVMLSVEAAKAFYNVVIRRFEICDRSQKNSVVFFIFIVYYRSTINNHSSKKKGMEVGHLYHV